jgi:hypothetical protein
VDLIRSEHETNSKCQQPKLNRRRCIRYIFHGLASTLLAKPVAPSLFTLFQAPIAKHQLRRCPMMSPPSHLGLSLTTVIRKGDYLEPGFNPSTLTTAQLRGIFLYHDVPYSSTHQKGELVQLFHDRLVPNASRLKKERLQMQNLAASNEGITLESITQVCALRLSFVLL